MKQFFAPCLVLASMLGTTFAHAASMPVDTDARFKLGLNASINQYAYDKDNDVKVLLI